MSDISQTPDRHEPTPNLVKEWHPTKNGRLTPKNVSSTYDKKIWWLCENGHEWEATIQDRVKGERCPDCLLELVKEKYGKFEEPSYKPKYMRDEGNISQKPYPSFQLDSAVSSTTFFSLVLLK